MKERWVTAVEMAREAGVEAKTFRRALRNAKLPWHGHMDRWSVIHGSSKHEDMRRVLEGLQSTACFP